MSTVHVVLDVSGSMGGKKLKDAIEIASIVQGNKQFYVFNTDIREMKESEFNEVRARGGTDIPKALDFIFNTTREGKLCIITDCQDTISPENVIRLKNKWNELKDTYEPLFAYVHVIGNDDGCQVQLKEIFGEGNVGKSTPEEFRQNALEQTKRSNCCMVSNETINTINEEIAELKNKSNNEVFTKTLDTISTQVKKTVEANQMFVAIEDEYKTHDIKIKNIASKSIEWFKKSQNMERVLPSDKVKMRNVVKELNLEITKQKENGEKLHKKSSQLIFKIKRIIATLGEASRKLKTSQIEGISHIEKLTDQLITSMEGFNNELFAKDNSDETKNCVNNISNTMQTCDMFKKTTDKTVEDLQLEIRKATEDITKTLEYTKEKKNDIEKFKIKLLEAVDRLSTCMNKLADYY